MFDNIICNHPLPVTKDILDLGVFDVYELELQTKSLENLMEVYTITEDGDLLRKKCTYEWEDNDEMFLKGYLKETSSENINENFHGKIVFYFYEVIHSKDEKNNVKETTINLDYEAKFIDGKLSSMELIDQSIEDTTEHYHRTQEIFKKYEEQSKLWYNKYFLNTKIVRYIRRNIIYKFVYKIHQFTGKLQNFVVRYL